MENNLPNNHISKEKIEAVLSHVKNLPSIPKVIFEVTRLLNNPNTPNNTLANVISRDQGLTAKILSVANSPLYGIKRKVSSIDFAVLVLGQQEVKNVVTALALADSFKIQPSQNFNALDFWLHSMVVGSAAKAISTDLGFSFGGDAFVAGSLHDLGILLIYQFMNNDFNTIIEKAEKDSISIIQAEYNSINISHQEAGMYLAEKWNLPLTLCDTLNFHHTPSKASENVYLVSIVHLADYMTQKFGVADFYWDNNFKLDPQILEILNFKSEEALDEFIIEYEELFKITAASIRI